MPIVIGAHIGVLAIHNHGYFILSENSNIFSINLINPSISLLYLM